MRKPGEETDRHLARRRETRPTIPEVPEGVHLEDMFEDVKDYIQGSFVRGRIPPRANDLRKRSTSCHSRSAYTNTRGRRGRAQRKKNGADRFGRIGVQFDG